MLKIRCDTCRQKIAVPQAYAGRSVKCPACKALVTVPMEPVAAERDDPRAPDTRTSSRLNMASTATLPPPVAALPDSPPPMTTIAEASLSSLAATPEPSTPSGDRSASPSPPLSPIEFAKAYPKAVALIALVFVWPVLSVLIAMAQAFAGAGGLALATLAAGAGHVALGVGLCGRRDWSWPATVGASAFATLLLAAAVVGGAALLILPLVLSGTILALALAERQAFRRSSPSWLATLRATPAAVRRAAAAIHASPTPPSAVLAPAAAADIEASRSKAAASKCRFLFRLFLTVAIILGGFVVARLCGLNPKGWERFAGNGHRYRAYEGSDYVYLFLATAISTLLWGGAAFAAMYLPLRWRAIANLPAGLRRRGRVGGLGLVAIALLAAVGLAIAPDRLTPSPSSAIQGPTFAEIDQLVGLASLRDDGTPRVDRTEAQRQAALAPYLGQRVAWSGTVLEVQDNVVYFAFGPSLGEQVVADQQSAARRLVAKERGHIGQDDAHVALKLADDQRAGAASLSKGQTIRFTGRFAGIGDPYPYLIEDGQVE